ncbi:uncharacterized protein LOC111363091 [Spodoptera litura]|uniref:Uncharacterized protein LOC111363091 n=1 Tax=Spodoptera litura TaxID=69820 RepID=A0A9J7EPV7_SPOLT|nr:uncharacterized protein LOC111363091 [Spodoptera litura]
MRWIILVSLCLVLAALADGKREKNDDGSTSYRDLLKRLIEVAGKQSHTGWLNVNYKSSPSSSKSRVHNLGDLSFRYIANVSPPQSEDPKDYLVQRMLELAAEHHGRGSLQISYRQSPGSAKKSRVHNLGVIIDEEKLEQVNEFLYLGSLFMRDEKYDGDIERKSLTEN